MNPGLTRNGALLTGPHGEVITRYVPGAPNGDTFGDITVLTPAGAPRYFTITQETPMSGTYLGLKLHVYGSDGDVAVVVPWTVPAAKLAELQADTGEIYLGSEIDILPRRLGMQIDSFRFVPRNATGEGRCAAAPVDEVVVPDPVVPFVLTADPVLGACTEGQALTYSDAVGTWDSRVTVAAVFQIAEDGAETGAESIAPVGGICPAQDGALDTLFYGNYFVGPGVTDEGDPGSGMTVWSTGVLITAAVVETVVTVLTPPTIDTAPVAGAPIDDTPGTYTGTPTGVTVEYLINTVASDTGETVFTPSGGAWPATAAGKFVKRREKATGYGVAVSPGYLLNETAWTEVSAQPVLMLADDEWLIGTPSAVSGTVDRLDVLLTVGSRDLDGLGWGSSTDEQYDAGALPEATVAGSPVNLVVVRYDGASAIAGFVPGASLTLGASAATLYRHVSLTPLPNATGVLFFETLSGAVADDAVISCTNGAAVANGAKATVAWNQWSVSPAIHNGFDYRQFRDGLDDVRRTRIKTFPIVDGVTGPRSLQKTLPNPPAPTNAGVWSRWTMRKEGQFLAKEVGGTGLQFPRCSATSPAKPGRVFCGIDVTRPTMTDNFGEWWTSPRMRRMFANMSSMGAGIDRGDGDRILFYGSTGPNQVNAAWNALNGIYLSTDGGATAALVLPLPDSPGSNRGSRRTLFHCLAQAPGSAVATARTWYCVHPRATWTPDALVNTQVYQSTNGGSNWTAVFGQQTAGWLNEVYGIETRVNGAGHDVYVWGEGGVKRRASGASAWSAVTGLPVKTIYHLETTAEGHVYAVAKGTGLYKSTNGVAFTQILAGNYDCFAVAKAALPNGKRRVWVCSHTTSVAARWSDDDGVTWTHGGSNNVINSIPFPDLSGENLGGNAVFFIPHETDPDECLVMRAQHMGRLILAEKNAAGNYDAVWSSRGFDYSRINSVSFGATYKDCAFAATDRVTFASDHGPNYTHSVTFTDTLRGVIYNAIEGSAGKYTDYQGGAPLLLENNGHKRLVTSIGEGKSGGPKIPVVFGPEIQDLTAIKGSAASISALTSLVMPKGSLGGTYQLRCTATPRTFTLYAPTPNPGQLGAVLGTTNGSTGAQDIGGITFTLPSGTIAAGSDPSRYNWYYNPYALGDLMTGASSTVSAALFSQRNPTTAVRGGGGKAIFSMNSSGVISKLRGLTYEFYGYSDGNVIWGLDGSSIRRSPDEGATWTLAFSPPGAWSNLQRSQQAIFASSHDNKRCYRVNDAGQMHRIDTNGSGTSGVATLLFDYLTVMGSLYPSETPFVGSGSPARPACKTVTEDPNDANVLHVAMAFGGTSSVFRSVNGGTTWTDLTATAGMLQDCDILMAPTGEVIVISQHGTAIASTTASALLDESIKSDIDRFIGDAGNYVGV